MIDPSATERDRIEKLADSFMTSFRAGQRPSIDAYVEQYPDLADQLRGLIAALIVLERNAPRRNRFEALRVERPPGASAPREIGEFTIVREIGRGGMGVVYEAVQQSLGRHVALKVLSSPGLLNPTHLERFRLEARSAGRLHHGHIVPVFGVGESDGLHYYAMQFIAGQSLDQVIVALRRVRPGHGEDRTAPPAKDELTESIVGGLLSGRVARESPADQNGAGAVEPPAKSADETPRVAGETSATPELATTGQFSSGSSGRPFYESVARVALQVAEALAYAHAKGILHRDIKPSNLLLDGQGNTWVTDFGLVKVDDSQSLTETGDFVGTLRYMAPERLDGWSDRRSDIYSLGVTLYELLTLRTFFESANRGQLIDHIRHKQPEAPTKIDPSIPRDLETIVLKALSKEPGSRYHTAEEMAEDLRRFLADRPIRARRSTPTEQFVRWCRRNPLVASLATTTALALVVGLALATIGFVQARRQAVRADREAEIARTQAARSEQVAQFLKDMLEAAGPSVALGRDATLLREILDKTSDRIGTDLKHQPEVEAELRTVIGDTYFDIGDYAKALAMHRNALAIYTDLLGDENPQVASLLFNVGYELSYLGKQLEAEPVAREALAMWKKLRGPESPEVADSLGSLYLALSRQAEFALAPLKRVKQAEAESVQRESLAICRKLQASDNTRDAKTSTHVAIMIRGTEKQRVSHALSRLASILADQGKSEEAESTAREALAMDRKAFGNEGEDIVQSLHILAQVIGPHKPAEAETLERESVAIRRKSLGDIREDQGLAYSLRNLAGLLHKNGKLAEAESLFRESLHIWRKFLGGEHPYVADELQGLALVLRDQGKLAEAETRFREALALRRKALGNEHLRTIASLNDLIEVLHREGKKDEAEVLRREAAELIEQPSPTPNDAPQSDPAKQDR